jgi:hypothetical protein
MMQDIDSKLILKVKEMLDLTQWVEDSKQTTEEENKTST